MPRNESRETQTAVDSGSHTTERDDGPSIRECKRCPSCGTVAEELFYTYCGNCASPLVRAFYQVE